MSDRSEKLDSLRREVGGLDELISGMEEERGSQGRAPGEWSPAMVVSHLADAELMSGIRIRLVLTRDRPVLTAYDQDAWAERFSPLEQSMHDSYVRFRALRENNIRILESLPPEQWERTGLHEEHGEVSVEGLVDLIVGHVSAHMEQIRRSLA